VKDNDLYEYDKYRCRMQTGDILQWASPSILGWLIRRFSGATVNHTSLIIMIKEYYEDRVFTTEALRPGMMMTSVSRQLVNYPGSVWWLPLLAKYDEYRKEIGRATLATLGTKYDKLSLIKQAFMRVSANARNLYCSEQAFVATKRAGVPELQSLTIAPRPGDMPELGIYGIEIQIL
jgi:hypothetical protein